MRQGNFSEVTAPIKNPFTGQNYPGNLIPPSSLSATAREFLEYYPMPNRPGIASNLQADSSNVDNVDQLLTRVDQNLGNKVRLSVRYNWHDSYTSNIGAIHDSGDHPAPRQPQHAGVLHTYIEAEPAQRFPDRLSPLDFDTLNHFAVNSLPTAGSDLGIPGFDGDVRYDNPGIPTINISAFSGLGQAGTNWYQFDTTFQVSNVLCVHARFAQHSSRVRRCGDSHWPACGKRPARSLRCSPATSLVTLWPISCWDCRERCGRRWIRSRATWADGATGSLSTTCGKLDAISR